MSTPADKKLPTIGTELPTRYFVALKKIPSNSEADALCTVINMEKTASVMPITHLRTLFISFAVSENDRSGASLDMKLMTITAAEAGKIISPTMLIAPPEINSAAG